MAEDSGKLVSGETRHALGDLTNLPRKRLFSSILGDLLHKSEGESGRNVAHEGSRVEFSKRLCLVVDDLVKENDTNEGSSSECKISSCDSDGKESGESHDAATVEDSSVDGKPLKEMYFEPGDRDGARELNEADQAAVAAGEGLALSVFSSNAESQNPLPKCQNLRSFEMSRCSNVNQNMGEDLLKSCSCSFCLKAAYIWSDLHYQDIKGRLSALKKSQKQASNMIQRNGKERPLDFLALANSASSANLESDLMGQWRSLFLSMGDILAHESNQLQNRFLTMKELREDCKIDLERATKTFQENA
ncbi:hypothetical protein EUTSA_v10014214mg [Eutrema salsugineum]|uniref:Uncharacterized protein n=1 Tax=Eutrema salsugineum TaxID=72664 RepID=V4LBA8_EUTSA|nr:uncharacterized protein LOC18017618 [Eutrema salsugineum]ESQ40954.1 hypothetical protein EUTSA_v10014214mg [Eutrema salsugineum]